MRRLLILAALCAFSVGAQTLPTAPQLTIDTTQPDTTGYNVKTVCASGCDHTTFAAAYAAIAGTDLTNGVIVRGSASFTNTVTAVVTLPYKNMSATKWIITETTSSGTSCPATGTRLTIATAGTANLASIKSNTATTSMINTAAGSGGNTPHHYWFRCMVLELTVAQTDVFRIGTGETTSANLPHHFVLDRVYIKAPDTVNISRCIAANGNYIAVVDSSVYACTHTGSDAQAIGSWNSEGPIKVDNSYLAGSGEIILFGGATPGITNLVTSDVTVTRNYFFKPLSWKSGDPTYDGRARSVKNHFEIKNAQRVLLEGNIFENAWCCGQRSMIVLTPKSNGGAVPWATASDIEFRWNRFTGAANLFNTWGVNPAEPAGVTKRLYIHNNLAEDIVGTNWGGNSADGFFLTAGWQGTATQPEDYTVIHNTAFVSAKAMSLGAISTQVYPTPLMNALKFIDNIIVTSTGVTGCCANAGMSNFSEGNNTITGLITAPTFTTNVLQGRAAANYNSYSGNFFPPSVATIDFTTQSGYFCTNCDLNGGSPYKTAGTAGSQIGISNWTTFGTKTCGAVGGEWSCAGGGLPAPTVSSITPTSGAHTGGTSVSNLAGTGFQAGAIVTFGGVAATSVVVVSSTQITCVTPAHAAGAVNVVITNPDLQAATLTNGYTYTGSGGPTISTLATSETGAARGSSFGGYTLTIGGTGFAQGLSVLVGGQTCGNVIVTGTTSISCGVQAKDAPSAVNVTVTNPDAQAATSTGGFTYTKPVIGRP